MATLTYAQIAIQGTNPGFASATSGGDKVAPNDRGVLLLHNGSGSSITVTVATPGNDRYGQARPDIAVAVPAGADRAVGPFPSDLADPSDGLVAITYSGVSSLTVAAVTI